MRAALALLISVGLHAGLLAIAAVLLGVCGEGPEIVAEIDLASVELSIAEKDAETAEIRPMPAIKAEKPPRPREERREEKIERELTLPPDATAPKLPEPEENERIEEYAAPAQPSPDVAPQQARVDAPPRPKKSIRPYYPPEARQRGEQGEVMLEIAVGADGAVEEVRVAESCGFAGLDEEAVRAVKAARFTPAKSGGRNVASVARLRLKFKLK